MELLLMSFLHSELERFTPRRIAYINDAARLHKGSPFTIAERNAVKDSCTEFIELSLSDTPREKLVNVLSEVDGIYIASGSTFDLLHTLRATKSDQIIKDAVFNGVMYMGSSAGAIIAGPSIEPASVMDDPEEAPNLSDYQGLNLVPHVVIPHAQGTTGPYTIDIISATVQKYGTQWPLVLLRDGQALHVSDQKTEII